MKAPGFSAKEVSYAVAGRVHRRRKRKPETRTSPGRAQRKPTQSTTKRRNDYVHEPQFEPHSRPRPAADEEEGEAQCFRRCPARVGIVAQRRGGPGGGAGAGRSAPGGTRRQPG